MAYATDADLLVRIPAASAIDPDLRAANLLDARCLMEEALFGDCAVPAHVYLTAHLLALSGDATAALVLGGETGPVTSLKAGEIAASFAAAPVMSGEWLALTKWGRMFLTFSPIHSGVVG